jgi:hypothetical protein
MTDAMQSERMKTPGQRHGVQGEWLLIADVIPGHAAALRELMARTPEKDDLRYQAARSVGTVHNYRSVLFDNDTRYLFATVYDGSWEAYLDDFGASPFFSAAFDATLQHTEGYPGWNSPGRNDWVEAHQVTAMNFTSAYGDLTVQQVWKQQRAYEALQAVLDTPEFQAAVKNPAYAELLQTQAFQQLLDEGSS